MSAEITFGQRLKLVLLPTPNQALIAVTLALILIIIPEIGSLLHRFGINEAAVEATRQQFNLRFDYILHSAIASNIALVAFWATVGLISYLICWGAYNILIEARNEVTLNTEYTNRGHWHSPYHTLALKAVCAVGFGLVLLLSSSGFSLWYALSLPVFDQISAESIGLAALAVLGFAAHLYIILVFIELTFAPWYRIKTFTEL